MRSECPKCTPALRETAAGSFGSVGLVGRAGTTLKPQAEPKPPPDPAVLLTAFWEEPDVFYRLMRISGLSAEKWAKEEFRRDPARALERLCAREDLNTLNHEAEWLAEVLPPEKLGPESLRLLDQPGEAARAVGLRFAGKWLAKAPQETIRSLDQTNPAALDKLLMGDPNMIYALKEKMADMPAVRNLLESITQPEIRARALARLAVLYPGKSTESADSTLALIVAMPPSRSRTELVRVFGAKIYPGAAIAPEAVLKQVLAIDPAVQSELRDELLTVLAERAAFFNSGSGTLRVELARCVRDAALRYRLLTETLPRHAVAGGEGELMDLLAEYPAGREGIKAIAAYAGALAERSGVEALRWAAEPHPPIVRAAVLKALLEKNAKGVTAAEVAAALAALPQEWQSEELKNLVRRHRARQDPEGVWAEVAAGGFADDDAALEAANVALGAWSERDPQAAFAAWLATGPAPEVANCADAFVIALFLPEVKAGREPPAATLQLILPTDKRNPCFNLYQTEDGRVIHVYYGLERLEVVPAAGNHPAYRMLVARLYNADVKVSALAEVFGLDHKTIRAWGLALDSGDPDALQRMLFGPPRKLTPAIREFVAGRRPALLAQGCRNYREVLQTEIKAYFGVSLSGESLRVTMNQITREQAGAEERASAAPEVPPSAAPAKAPEPGGEPPAPDWVASKFDPSPWQPPPGEATLCDHA